MAKSNVPTFKTLKECLEFLEWLNDRKRNVVRSQVASRLYRLLKERYNDTKQHDIEASMSRFLDEVSNFHKKLCVTPRGSYSGHVSAKNVLCSLLDCLPRLLSAIYFLRYQVDDGFKTLGGGDWAGEDVGKIAWFARYGPEYVTRMTATASKIDKYLLKKAGDDYGVISGGFEAGELKELSKGEYSEGKNMASDFINILNKHSGENTQNYFLDVYSTTVLSTSGFDTSNVANALRLVQDFCKIFEEVDRKDFENHLYSKDRCINLDELKKHCGILQQSLGKIFKDKRFSFTGYAREYHKLTKHNIAKKMASWLKKNLNTVKDNLKRIEPFNSPKYFKRTSFRSSSGLRPPDRAKIAQYFIENFLRYGFTFYYHDYKKHGPPFDVLKKDWDDVIKMLNQADEGLDKLKKILDGDRCPTVEPENDEEANEDPPDVEFVDEGSALAPKTVEPPPAKVPEAPQKVGPEKKVAVPKKPEVPSAKVPEIPNEKSEGAQNQGKKAEGAQNQGKKAEGAQNQGKKTEGAQNQGKKAEGAQNQGKKTEGAQNQGKKAEGNQNRSGGQSDRNGSSAGPPSPGAPSPSRGQDTGVPGATSGAGQGSSRETQTGANASNTTPTVRVSSKVTVRDNLGAYGQDRGDNRWWHTDWWDKGDMRAKLENLRQVEADFRKKEDEKLRDQQKRLQGYYNKLQQDQSKYAPVLSGLPVLDPLDFAMDGDVVKNDDQEQQKRKDLMDVYNKAYINSLRLQVERDIEEQNKKNKESEQLSKAAEHEWKKQKQEGIIQKHLDDYGMRQQHKRKQAAKKHEATLKENTEEIWQMQQQQNVEHIEKDASEDTRKRLHHKKSMQRKTKVEQQNISATPPTSTPSTLPMQHSRPAPAPSSPNTGGRNGHRRDYYVPRELQPRQVNRDLPDYVFADGHEIPIPFLDAKRMEIDAALKTNQKYVALKLREQHNRGLHEVQDQWMQDANEIKKADEKWKNEREEGERQKRFDDYTIMQNEKRRQAAEALEKRIKAGDAQKKREANAEIEYQKSLRAQHPLVHVTSPDYRTPYPSYTFPQHKALVVSPNADQAVPMLDGIAGTLSDSDDVWMDGGAVLYDIGGNEMPDVKEVQRQEKASSTGNDAYRRVQDLYAEQKRNNQALDEQSKVLNAEQQLLQYVAEREADRVNTFNASKFEIAHPIPFVTLEITDPVRDELDYSAVPVVHQVPTAHMNKKPSHKVFDDEFEIDTVDRFKDDYDDKGFKPMDLSFEIQNTDPFESNGVPPIPPELLVERAAHDATQDEDDPNYFDLRTHVPDRALPDSSYDIDLEYDHPPPTLQPLDLIGPATAAFDLTIPPVLDPQIPTPEDFDKRTIIKPELTMCLAPWATSTPTHGSTDIPETELFPSEAPRTVRDMLTWLAGLRNPKHHKTLEKCMNKAFNGLHKDTSQLAIPVNGSHIRPTDVFDILQLTAMFAGSVLTAIAPNWKSNVSSKTVTSNSPTQSDEPDCCALFCQLRDYAYACHHQLQFLKAQCERDKSLGGWKSHEYGSDPKTSSPLQAFLTDGWDCPFDTHLYDPCNLCHKSRVRMAFYVEDLPKTSQVGSVISSILSPSCGEEGLDALLGTMVIIAISGNMMLCGTVSIKGIRAWSSVPWCTRKL